MGVTATVILLQILKKKAPLGCILQYPLSNKQCYVIAKVAGGRGKGNMQTDKKTDQKFRYICSLSERLDISHIFHVLF